jgi:primosomal protein N' (replication factor Y)
LAARDQDFNSFYHQEITFRKALNYPPFSRMIQLKISGKDPALTRNYAHQLGDRCRTLKTSNSSLYGSVEIMGPIESSLTKVARRYRWQILLKGRYARALHQFASQLLAENSTVFHNSRVRVVVDVDPVSLL